MATTLSIRYASWRPVGRSLLLVDLENLAGPNLTGAHHLTRIASGILGASAVQPGDHVVVATNPRQLLDARVAFPGARLLVGRGPDGADRALLADWEPEDLARRYDRLVVASGDHAFASLAQDVRSLGVEVHVVAWRRSLSGRLREAADQVLTPRRAR